MKIMNVFGRGAKKPKIYHYDYKGLFEVGDEVTIDEYYTTRQFEIDKHTTVNLPLEHVGVISRKDNLGVTHIGGGTWLTGHEAYFEYNVRFTINEHEIEIHHIPEWLISDA